MSTELKPCPFCNSTNINAASYIRDGIAVICRDCSATTRAFNPNAREKAAEAWNRRPTELVAVKAQDDLVDALRGLIAAVGDWSRPTGANGMTSASPSHPLSMAATKGRTALAAHDTGSALVAGDGSAATIRALQTAPAKLDDETRQVLEHCQSALAMMISPESIKATSVLNAFAVATAADTAARELLGRR